MGSYSHNRRIPIPVNHPSRRKLCHPPQRRQQLLEGCGTWHGVAQASGVHQWDNPGYPIAGWFIVEHPTKMDDDWGYSDFKKRTDVKTNEHEVCTPPAMSMLWLFQWRNGWWNSGWNGYTLFSSIFFESGWWGWKYDGIQTFSDQGWGCPRKLK